MNPLKNDETFVPFESDIYYDMASRCTIYKRGLFCPCLICDKDTVWASVTYNDNYRREYQVVNRKKISYNTNGFCVDAICSLECYEAYKARLVMSAAKETIDNDDRWDDIPF